MTVCLSVYLSMGGIYKIPGLVSKYALSSLGVLDALAFVTVSNSEEESSDLKHKQSNGVNWLFF